MEKHVQRPAVLYVEGINFHPKLPDKGDRVTVIDIEITEQMAEKIIEELKNRLSYEKNSIAGIRIRFSGKMVLS